jgi:hypothetical protein
MYRSNNLIFFELPLTEINFPGRVMLHIGTFFSRGIRNQEIGKVLLAPEKTDKCPEKCSIQGG